MSKKLTRRVTTKHKIKIPDNRPLPEPAESMVAPVLAHPVSLHHEYHEAKHPFGPKISPLSMAEISTALPTTTRSSAIYSQSSYATRTESGNASRSTFCSGYDSADDSGTFIGLHDLGSDFRESGTSFMSWSDEIDNDSTKKLQDMYDGLEKFLYDEAEFPSNVSKDLLEECLIWKETFPYKRSKQPDCASPEPTSHVELESSPQDISVGSKPEPSQEVLKDKVKGLVLENLSSNLLSNVLQTLTTDISELRAKSEESHKVTKTARSRSSSPRAKSHSNQMPPLVLHKPCFDTRTQSKRSNDNVDFTLQAVPMHISESRPSSNIFFRRTIPSSLDKCLGSSVESYKPLLPTVPDISSRIASAFAQPLPHKHLTLQPVPFPEYHVNHSAVAEGESYPSSTDHKLSAFNSVFSDRKSPRQDVILKNLQEERLKHSARTGRNVDLNSARQRSRIPSVHKPPWIGFANITLPPINHAEHSAKGQGTRKSSSPSRNRKVSPCLLVNSAQPFEVNGTGMTRLHMAKKIVEHNNMSQPGASSSTRTGNTRKAKK